MPQPPEPSTAPVSLGKYSLLRQVGRGGMGVVYEAIDTALNRRVALKLMIPVSHLDPEEAAQDEQRFLREGHLAAGLPKHPNMVGVYEAGVIDGKRYLAMEFIDGESLSEWCEKGKKSRRAEVALLRDAAMGVHHAHEQGIIHRDLKPANILVDTRDCPHISDFGLAKMVGPKGQVSLTNSGFIVGTPAYISPEQARGLETVD